MKPKANEIKSFFSIANRLFREKKFEDAIGIYEILREIDPSFLPYTMNDQQARLELAKRGQAKFKKKYHLPNASDYQKRLRMANVISYLNEPPLIDCCFDPDQLQNEYSHLLAQASACVAVDYEIWVALLNKYLKVHNISAISLKPREEWAGDEVFVNINLAQLPRVDGPLVSLCMSCFNAEKYVETAVRSLLNQSYHNFELFLFNDCSVDGTLGVLRRLAEEDRRITVIDNEINQGTYVSRNQAFERAKGDYFAIMDADDISLPERLALQVDHLQRNLGHMGVLTEWLRIAVDGRPHFKLGWGGVYQHEAVATLMIRTSEVRQRIGYWDSVRFAADTEFLFRMRKVYGNQAVPLWRIPTHLSLFHEASLTNDPVTGISVAGMKGLSPTRIAYRESWLKWHTQNEKNLYTPFPLERRLFDAPIEMMAIPRTNA